MSSQTVFYGVLSDTPGVLPAAVHEALAGVCRVFHCGDVGSQAVLNELLIIAPVTAVAGNMDPWPLAGALPETLVDRTEFGTLAMAHAAGRAHDNALIAQGLLHHFRASDPRVILFGHSHEAYCRTVGNTLFLNPGSASRPVSGERGSVVVLEYDPASDRLDTRFVHV